MRRILWLMVVGLLAGLIDPHAAQAHARWHAAHHAHVGHWGRHAHRRSQARRYRQNLRALRRHQQAMRHRRFAIVAHGHQGAANLHPSFHRIAKGVGFWEGSLDTPAGRVHFDALKVNLALADVAPVPSLAPDGNFTLARTSWMVRHDHAIAGINGSFFSPRSRQPAGMLVVAGRILAGPDSRPALIVRNNGTASILPDRTAIRRDPMQALGGGPTLLRHGHILIWGRPPAIGGRQPRTAVGLCPGDQILLLTIDGRSQASVGATLPEEARYMAALGASDAINLDGGGSTTMAITGHVVNRPSDGTERAVSNALLVFPKGTYVQYPFRYSGYSAAGSVGG